MNAAPTVALVTGANQGLGLALVAALCRDLPAGSAVYLTARDEARGAEALDGLRAQGLSPRWARLDVTSPDSVAELASTLQAEHGGLDLVISNAAHRMAPDIPPAAQVRPFVTTNNLATTRLLEAFGPMLRDGGRFIVVASSFGRLRHLPAALRARFDAAKSLEAVDAIMLEYIGAVECGTAKDDGWPEWINIPSKVGQVASMRVYARQHREEAERRGLVVTAACPGLVDTAASRPWFEDMSKAQTPEAAAADLVWLATAPRDEVPYGELVQHRKVLSWAA